MSTEPIAETIETRDCSIILRRVEGDVATELFAHCRPRGVSRETTQQTRAIYRALADVLAEEGGSLGNVARETLYLRDVAGNIARVRAVRGEFLESCSGAPCGPASHEILQPPIDERAQLEVSVEAVLPRRAPLDVATVPIRTGCSCAECVRMSGLRLRLGDESRLYASGLYGQGVDAYEQTLAMFEAAEALLHEAGMEFKDVVRTWIHLREMERDYAEFNRARRAFFEARGIDPVPASTGIGGGPVASSHPLCLGFYAIKAERPLAPAVMTTPTLNEAMSYGADFVRGMRIAESNKVALHVSGTASIDEAGRTAHPGDLDAQVDRMLLNVETLLEGEGAGFGDVVSAVTYVKNPADAESLSRRLDAAGFTGFPNAIVAAEVCRPELLCETEVLAVLPSPGRSDSAPG